MSFLIEPIFNYFRKNGLILHDNEEKLNKEYKRLSNFNVDLNTNIIFSHKPIKALPKGYINIHWHLHSRINNLPKNKYFCYSAEKENYMPLLLNNIINKIKWEKQLFEASLLGRLLMLKTKIISLIK